MLFVVVLENGLLERGGGVYIYECRDAWHGQLWPMPMLLARSTPYEVIIRKRNLCPSNVRMIIRSQTALAVVVAMGHLVVFAMSATALDNARLSDPFLDVKRPADQDAYDAYVSGEKSLVTSFQVTPVIATNTECIEKGKNCEWREVGIH